MTIQTVGIIGYGRFGKLLAGALRQDFRVRVFDSAFDSTAPAQWNMGSEILPPPQGDERLRFLSLEATAESDAVFLCVPILHFDEAARRLAEYIPRASVVLDVCSVKLYPAKILRERVRPVAPILPTHPMFGPVSARDGWTDLPFVFCPEPDAGDDERAALEFWSDYVQQTHGARALTMSADEHDRVTAYNLCLTQLLGRALGAMGIRSSAIDAESFKRLLAMKDMSYSDSMDLLIGMHRFNPYAAEMRERLIGELAALDAVIRQESDNVQEIKQSDAT
jgi:prephenate dehydrogenase